MPAASTGAVAAVRRGRGEAAGGGVGAAAARFPVARLAPRVGEAGSSSESSGVLPTACHSSGSRIEDFETTTIDCLPNKKPDRLGRVGLQMKTSS